MTSDVIKSVLCSESVFYPLLLLLLMSDLRLLSSSSFASPLPFWAGVTQGTGPELDLSLAALRLRVP